MYWKAGRENGLLSGDLPEDFFMIDMSSISRMSQRRLGRSLEGMGIKFVDGPVSGGQSGAMNGTLTIMAGGKEEDVKNNADLRSGWQEYYPLRRMRRGTGCKGRKPLMSAINLISMSEALR
ncbi:MAG: NAD(P)-binding domain-containing protein [[Clostridium] scindens]